ncbi:uncharacterized protein LOC106461844 [Limulus polyphemus]|uniref:Uncharacterized protein LOC106461844 n=1 Tax=Limulus polyphemus TaxID=6850 RepID=A0ABM1SLW9_LIMPO|nr:uncharacterized protein LOC106461844 [Limulus polyphemus]
MPILSVLRSKQPLYRVPTCLQPVGMFIVLIWAIVWAVDGWSSDKIDQRTQEQILATSERGLLGNISNFHCDDIFTVIHDNVTEAKEENIHIVLSHPFLDINQGLIAGVVYDVWLTALKNIERPLVITSLPAGNFTSYPSSAVPCVQTNDSLTSVVLLSLEADLHLNWFIPANTTEEILNLEAFYQEVGGQWTLSRIWHSRRSDCFQLLSVQKQSLTSEELSSESRYCNEYKVFIDSFPSTLASFKLLDLTSSSPFSSWIILTVDSEKSPGHTVSAMNHDKKEPYYTAIARYFLLTIYRCKDCQFRAAFFPLDYLNDCNASVSAWKGILTSPNFPENYMPRLDCFYQIRAPPGFKIFVSVLEFDIYVANAQKRCMQDFVRFFPLEERKEISLCGNSTGVRVRKLLVSKHEILTVHFHTKRVSQGKGFLLEYRSIKRCQNVTITQQNGSFCTQDYPYAFMNGQNCHYAFYVPFGYEIVLELTFLETSLSVFKTGQDCQEEFIEISNPDQVQRFCGVKPEYTNHNLHFHSSSYNINITVNINAISALIDEAKGFCVNFQAIPSAQNTSFCDYPWAVKDNYCYKLLDQYMDWQSANNYCGSLEGHLATVSTDDIQSFLETLIKTSPLYGQAHAFWIGANDIEHENSYDWADGYLFGYSNWFPGWTDRNYYNSQPSDDGLSSQDCVELRDLFRYPSKGEGRTRKFYWNDRDCKVKNPFLCQRPRPGGEVRRVFEIALPIFLKK